MRVNIYAEEITDRVEIVAKEIDGRAFTAVRFYLELPATVNGEIRAAQARAAVETGAAEATLPPPLR